MNSTQRVPYGGPRGRARVSGREVEPGEAEERIQLCQQAGQEGVDCCVHFLKNLRSSPLARRPAQSVATADLKALGSPLRGNHRLPCGLPNDDPL